MAEFPPGFIGRIGDGFRKNHWFRPLKPRFWDKSREFCSTVIGFKPRPPGIFSHGFQSKSARGTEERAQIFLTGHLRRHSPLRNFFVYAARTRLSANWATRVYAAHNSWFHETFLTIFGFFFKMIWVLLCIFKVIFALFFKSTLECFLHALRLYQISKLGYGMFSDSNVSFLHFYCLEVSSSSNFTSNHFIVQMHFQI